MCCLGAWPPLHTPNCGHPHPLVPLPAARPPTPPSPPIQPPLPTHHCHVSIQQHQGIIFLQPKDPQLQPVDAIPGWRARRGENAVGGRFGGAEGQPCARERRPGAGGPGPHKLLLHSAPPSPKAARRSVAAPSSVLLPTPSTQPARPLPTPRQRTPLLVGVAEGEGLHREDGDIKRRYPAQHPLAELPLHCHHLHRKLGHAGAQQGGSRSTHTAPAHCDAAPQQLGRSVTPACRACSPHTRLQQAACVPVCPRFAALQGPGAAAWHPRRPGFARSLAPLQGARSLASTHRQLCVRVALAEGALQLLQEREVLLGAQQRHRGHPAPAGEGGGASMR